jgi:hypothetical protein
MVHQAVGRPRFFKFDQHAPVCLYDRPPQIKQGPRILKEQVLGRGEDDFGLLGENRFYGTVKRRFRLYRRRQDAFQEILLPYFHVQDKIPAQAGIFHPVLYLNGNAGGQVRYAHLEHPHLARPFAAQHSRAAQIPAGGTR